MNTQEILKQMHGTKTGFAPVTGKVIDFTECKTQYNSCVCTLILELEDKSQREVRFFPAEVKRFDKKEIVVPRQDCFPASLETILNATIHIEKKISKTGKQFFDVTIPQAE